MFDDYAQLNRVADGPVGTMLFRKLEGKGIVGLAYFREIDGKRGYPDAFVEALTKAGWLAALLERERTGRGKDIDVSMLESMFEWMGYPLHYACDGAEPPPRAPGCGRSSSPRSRRSPRRR